VSGIIVSCAAAPRSLFLKSIGGYAAAFAQLSTDGGVAAKIFCMPEGRRPSAHHSGAAAQANATLNTNETCSITMMFYVPR